MIAEGQRIFRFDTFGDEQVWTDTLHLNEVVEKNVDPTTALGVGLKAYRTTPPRGMWQHPPYFHDGSAARFADVVAHDDRVRTLGLTAEQQRELVEYLKSL